MSRYCCTGQRPDDSVSQSCLSMQAVLQPEELALLLASKHRPSYVLQILSGLVESSCIVSPERFRMDQNITFFMDAQGSCERILKTPIPLSYTRWAIVIIAVVVTVIVINFVTVIVVNIPAETVMHAALKYIDMSANQRPPTPLKLYRSHVASIVTNANILKLSVLTCLCVL